MVRFFLFVAIAWLVSKIARLLFRSMARRRQGGPGHQAFGFKNTQSPESQMEFKDVRDAKFEDIPEKEKVQK